VCTSRPWRELHERRELFQYHGRSLQRYLSREWICRRAARIYAVRRRSRWVIRMSVLRRKQRLSWSLRRITLFAALAAIELAGPPQIHAGQPGQSTVGAVSGVISDGVSGGPLAGALVSLVDGRVKVAVHATTDSRGRFVFLGLPPSDGYSMSVRRQGYRVGDVAVRPPFALGAALRLQPGEWLRDVHVSMWPHGSISGTIVDEKGEPLVGAPVRVLVGLPIAGTTRWASGPGTRTDDTGTYRIAGLQSGVYAIGVPSVQSLVPSSMAAFTAAGLPEPVVGAVSSGPPRVGGLTVETPEGTAVLVTGKYPAPTITEDGSLLIFPPTFYPGVTAFSLATPIDLGEGEHRRSVDFRLQSVAARTVSGRVVGLGASTGWVARLFPEGALGLGSGSEQATTIIAPDGRFTFIGVPEGAYVIDVRSGESELALGAPHLPATAGMVGDRYLTFFSTAVGDAYYRTHYRSVQSGLVGRHAVEVGPSGVKGVVVIMTSGAILSGQIVGEGGQSVADPRVSVEPADGDPSKGGQPLSRQPGAFSVTGLYEGDYWLRVTATRLRVKSITYRGQDFTTRPFRVALGDDLSGIQIVMTDQYATLKGVVSAGQATSQVTSVVIFPADRAGWKDFGLTPSRIRTAVALAGQEYQFTGLPAGDYLVAAVDQSQQHLWQDRRFFPAIAPTAAKVTLSWGNVVTQHVTVQVVSLK